MVALMGEDPEKPRLTRESEPEEAWISKAEKEGKSPFKDPLAISAIIGITLPLFIVLISLATGVVEPPSR